ncbi:MAG TPA: hypothetical protein VGF70_10885 [Solirubrobacteraceae bacterium]|jgi:hypothetical protein
MTGVGGAAAPAVRAFAFAEPEAGGRWGAAWLPPGADPAGVLDVGDQPSAAPLQLDGAEATEPWRLTADPDTELVLEGLGPPAWSDPEARQEEFHQLCRVSGVAGGRPLESLGWRWAREPASDPAVRSFRAVAGWFDEQDGFAVAARRPGKAKGQDEDLIAAALFDPTGSRVVADPRLSTTYTESGQPTRAGVELWIEADAEPDHLYPRRAVGQAVRAPVPWRVAEVAMEAQPFRWFSGGREGPGVYLLGQW